MLKQALPRYDRSCDMLNNLNADNAGHEMELMTPRHERYGVYEIAQVGMK